MNAQNQKAAFCPTYYAVISEDEICEGEKNMDYNRNYNMQYQPQMSLQTPEAKQMGLLLHLSQFANVIFFPLGIIAPILIWQLNKDKLPELDAHGKMVTNWMISATIYAFASFILMFLLIGFFTILAVAVMGIVFPIVGAIKANNGELWEYPLTIKFLK